MNESQITEKKNYERTSRDVYVTSFSYVLK